MLTASIIALLLLMLLAMFQIMLIAGVPLGRFAWGGQHEVLPARLRIGSVVSIAIYAVLATLILSKSGLWVVISNDDIVQIGLWIASIYAVLGIVMNAISRSKSERNVMVPVALVLMVCFLLITLA